MKFFHLSDLHLGKRLAETSLISDQKYILDQILNAVSVCMPDAVIIAGDVYDKALPSAQAVELFDYFLFELVKRKVQVFIVSGNHDSAERLAFASRLLSNSGVHVSPVYDGKVTPIVCHDAYGEVNVYLLPFIKPVHVRQQFPDEIVETYTDAIKIAATKMDADVNKRNVLVAHQFVTNSARSGSEEITVGGADNVDLSAFGQFDYIALGHIHGAQNIDGGRARYCGTPLKYSFSEANHDKSITVVTLEQKGDIKIDTISLKPIRDLKEIRGTYNQLMSKSFYENTDLRTAYVKITLTDEDDIPDAASKLRIVYTNLISLVYDNARTRSMAQLLIDEDNINLSPVELFEKLFAQQNNSSMSEQQTKLVNDAIEKIWGEDK